jgi:putative MATE family efflux protein
MKKTLPVSTRKKLVSLAWPLFIETALIMLIGSVDTIMIARFSNDASGAVGVGNQVIGLINLVFMIVSVGTSILVSQFIGAKLQTKVSQVTILSLLLNVILGILGMAVILLFNEMLLKLLQLDSDLLEYGKTYVRIVGLASIFQAITFSAGAIIRSYGFTKIGMKASLTANIINVILNYLLIYGVPLLNIPSMGVAGAAIATFISKLINCIILLIILFKVIDRNLSLKLLSPFPQKILRDILKIGLPSVGENMSYSMSQLVITGFVTSIGTIALNTKTFYSTIAMFIYAFTVAVANASSIMVGNLTGSNQQEESYHLGIYSMKFSMIVTLLINIIFAFFIVPLISIFTDNQSIITLAKTIVLLDIGLEVGRSINIMFGATLKASGDIRFPVFFAIIISWTIMIPLGYLLGIYYGFGLIGIWIALSVDEIIRGIILTFRWLSKKWQNKSFVKNHSNPIT